MKEIKDFPGYYITEDGRVFSDKQSKLKELKLSKNKYGYLRIVLNRVSRDIHRLVAKAFIPNPQNKKEVNHINGIKNDNRLENLEWATSSENRQHAFDTGLKKYTERQRRINSELFSKPVLDTQTGIFYNSAKEASRLLGINKNTLYGYLLGHNPNKTSLIYA